MESASNSNTPEPQVKPLPELHLGMRSGHNANHVYVYDGKDSFHDTGVFEVSCIPLHTTVKDVEAMKYPEVVQAVGRAKEIIRRCNAYPQLIEALKKVCSEDTWTARDEARKLLTKLNEGEAS